MAGRPDIRVRQQKTEGQPSGNPQQRSGIKLGGKDIFSHTPPLPPRFTYADQNHTYSDLLHLIYRVANYLKLRDVVSNFT